MKVALKDFLIWLIFSEILIILLIWFFIHPCIKKYLKKRREKIK